MFGGGVGGGVGLRMTVPKHACTRRSFAGLHRLSPCLDVALRIEASQGRKGPSTHYSRTLVPKATWGMVFGTRVLKYWVLGPSGKDERLFNSRQPELPWSTKPVPEDPAP